MRTTLIMDVVALLCANGSVILLAASCRNLAKALALRGAPMSRPFGLVQICVIAATFLSSMAALARLAMTLWAMP